VSGSVQAGGGYFLEDGDHYNLNGGATLNFRNKWLNTSLNANLRENQRTSATDVTSQFNDLSQYMHNQMDNTTVGQSVRLSNNFYIDKKNIIGLILSGSRNNADGKTGDNSRTEIYRHDMLVERSNNAGTSGNKTVNYSANANYQHIFKESTHDVLVNFDYMQYETRPWSRQENHFYDGAGNVLRPDSAWQNTSNQHVEIVSAKFDYTRPLWKKTSLETGGKISQTSTDNDILREELRAGEWQPNDRLSNAFRYHERIGAWYASVGTQFGKKWSAKAGLRWENTWSEGLWKDTTTRQSYNDFFPTLYAGYNHSMEHSFSLSYAKRIQRPDYGALNPFKTYSGAYAYNTGNPYLLPQYTHTLNLSYTHEKLTVSLYTQSARQVINQETVITGDSISGYPVTAVTYGNFGQTNFSGVTASLTNIFPYVWWSFNFYVSGFYTESTTHDYSSHRLFGNAYTEHTFYIGKTWRAEITANVRSPMAYGYYTVSGNYFMSAGVRKNLWKHAATVSLYVDDIFNSQRSHVLTDRNGQRIEMNSTWSSRQIRVSFSYRFRQAIKARERVGQVDESGRL
jgi:hypothetical protein